MSIPIPPGMKVRQTRQPMRQPMRQPGFVGRNGETLVRNNRSNTQADQFELPRGMMESGWSYQWVRTSCHGKPDPSNVNAHMENGWRPVNSSQADGWYHPKGYKGPIERDGLTLMERPAAMTQEAINDGIKAARNQRHQQSKAFAAVDAMLVETGGADAAFAAADAEHDHRGVARPMLKRTVEGIPGNMYPQRELALGDE